MNHDTKSKVDASGEEGSTNGGGMPMPGAVVPVRDEVRRPPGEMGRRAAMKLMAASTLLAVGAPGCRRKPHRKIVSMVDPPEYQKPGIPIYYASTWTEGKTPYGMMIKVVDGRPIKIEGLPDHPLNRGTSSAQMQASILSLYDPDRLRSPRKGKQDVTWKQADQEIVQALLSAGRVVLVTRSSLGPSERAMVKRFLASCSGARHFAYEPICDRPRREAWKTVYGADGQLQPRLDKAKIILSIDADFLGTDGPVLRTTRDFSQTRRPREGKGSSAGLSRLYVAESAMTVTGSNADHRLPLRPSLMGLFVHALRAALKGDTGPMEQLARAHHLDRKLLHALAGDLASHRSGAVVLAGPHLPAAVHADVALLNDELDAMGNTLTWNPSPATLPVNSAKSIQAAILAEGGVDVLIFLGINPGYDWPKETFQKIMQSAKCTIGHGLYHNETLAACTFALPSTHNLESWNDVAPATGLTTLCQPVIAPLFDARQEAESLLAWTRGLGLASDDAAESLAADWHAVVRQRWSKEVLGAEKDAVRAWEGALRAGMHQVSDTEAKSIVEIQPEAAERLAAIRPEPSDGFELVIRPHHAILDGRFARNAWLQELPDPVTKLVWENAAVMGPGTAKELGVDDNGLVVVEGGEGARVTLPVLIQPGVARGVVVTTLGHGRERAGDAGAGNGVNIGPLLGARDAALTPRLLLGIKVTVAAKRADANTPGLVRTQKTFSMMDRPIVLQGTAAEYERDPDFVAKRKHVPPLDQWDAPYDYSKGHKWVMAIDMNACTGCSACVVACQAENNIPVVGKEECGRGREMHWLRIDRYERGDGENPDVYQQPMLCQHCDNAPCENVCPVNATAHSTEGLNEQVYNRCVGTRYCANNCPYKVRRFNFFNYQGRVLEDSIQELVFNPQVTVRSRGVMEKCTFCIQRINEVKFQLRNEGEKIPDGAIRPACQQSCPAQAIAFGDINDPRSEVARMRSSSLAYHVLEELNVRPNVTYLARVTNPHPDVSAKSEGGHG